MIDGEHYPPVIRSALESLADEGHEILAAVLVGGKEKLPAEGMGSLGPFALATGDDPRATLDAAIREHRPDAVMDLSDEPVLDYRRRFELASLALWRDVPYQGADFTLSPPPRPRLAAKPSIAVIGTGKRTGKTAVAAEVARSLAGAERRPVVVAMGRGGPPEPEVLRGDQLEMTPQELMKLAEAGKHAASDYVEDAFLARVPTVGCRRCGGGLSGAVGSSNVSRGVEIANDLDSDLLVLEGSGTAIPPVHADSTILVMPSSVPEEHVAGYLGTYRLLLADYIVVTMCEEPFGSPSKISSLEKLVHGAWRPEGTEKTIPMIRTVFRPTPTDDVDGATVYVVTTAPPEAAESMRSHLEGHHGCTVSGVSHNLSDRGALGSDLDGMDDGVDMVLCEIKAAGVDVVTKRTLALGKEVVYMDNVPMAAGDMSVSEVAISAADLATERFGADG